MADFKPVLDGIFAQAHDEWAGLSARLRGQLANLEAHANAVLADLIAGNVTLAEAQDAAESEALAVRSTLLSEAADAAAKAPGWALETILKLVPLVFQVAIAA